MNILITGGASGLGEAITMELVKDSKKTVYFTYSSSKDRAREIELRFPNSKGIKCDFKNEASVNELLKTIPSLELTTLINNAYTGSFIKTHFHKTDYSEFINDFKNNVIPTVRITQEVLKEFRKKKNGKIITVLTAALVNTAPIGTAVYTATKSYMEKLSQTWASDYAKYNITSNSVSPSFMNTGMTAEMDERIVEQMTISHPYKKLLTVEEVAQTISKLLEMSNHVNGVNIPLNAATNLR